MNCEPLDREKKIYVAGHRGLVGSALVRRLERDGFTRIITRTQQGRRRWKPFLRRRSRLM